MAYHELKETTLQALLQALDYEKEGAVQHAAALTQDCVSTICEERIRALCVKTPPLRSVAYCTLGLNELLQKWQVALRAHTCGSPLADVVQKRMREFLLEAPAGANYKVREDAGSFWKP